MSQTKAIIPTQKARDNDEVVLVVDVLNVPRDSIKVRQSQYSINIQTPSWQKTVKTPAQTSERASAVINNGVLTIQVRIKETDEINTGKTTNTQ